MLEHSNRARANRCLGERSGTGGGTETAEGTGMYSLGFPVCLLAQAGQCAIINLSGHKYKAVKAAPAPTGDVHDDVSQVTYMSTCNEKMGVLIFKSCKAKHSNSYFRAVTFIR